MASQRAEGWVLVEDRYDDGGCIRRNALDHPALRRLLADIEAGLIDIVVVYKIDRLFRLTDGFHQEGLHLRSARRDIRFRHPVIQYHNEHGPTDAQHFARSLQLQFERNVITATASATSLQRLAQRGMWMGGSVPLGYDVGDRKLPE